jgi:hypothetical protein
MGSSQSTPAAKEPQEMQGTARGEFPTEPTPSARDEASTKARKESSTKARKESSTKARKQASTKARKVSSTKGPSKDPSKDVASDKTVIVRREWRRVAIEDPSQAAKVFYFERASDGASFAWRLGRVAPEDFARMLGLTDFLNGKELKKVKITVLFQVSNFDRGQELTHYVRTVFTSRTGFTFLHTLQCIRDASVIAAVASIREQTGFNSVRHGQVEEYLANRVVPKLFVNPSKGTVYVPIVVQHASRR